MPWTLILWLIQLLGPKLLELIMRFFNRTKKLAPEKSAALGGELVKIRESKLPRRAKRALALSVLRREAAAEANELATAAEKDACRYHTP